MAASLWQATGEQEYIVTGQLAAGAAFVTGGNAQHHRADFALGAVDCGKDVGTL